jgi:uncharacterized protein YoxC
MTIYEASALISAIAFLVVVAFLIPALIQFRKMAARSAALMARINEDLPSLIDEIRVATRAVLEMTEHLRDGVAHASGFLHAVGQVGDTVQQLHDTVRGKGGTLLARVSGLVAGIRAASAFIKERNSDEREEPINETRKGGSHDK